VQQHILGVVGNVTTVL